MPKVWTEEDSFKYDMGKYRRFKSKSALQEGIRKTLAHGYAFMDTKGQETTLAYADKESKRLMKVYVYLIPIDWKE